MTTAAMLDAVDRYEWREMHRERAADVREERERLLLRIRDWERALAALREEAARLERLEARLRAVEG